MVSGSPSQNICSKPKSPNNIRKSHLTLLDQHRGLYTLEIKFLSVIEVVYEGKEFTRRAVQELHRGLSA